MAPRIHYDDRPLRDQIVADEKNAYDRSVATAEKMLKRKDGPGNDFLGWLDLPKRNNAALISSIQSTAREVRERADILVCIGIGGSYLGARAAIEYMLPSFDDLREKRVIFAGHQVNSDYLADLKQLVDRYEVAVNVISKSGTTTEPGITFRVVRKWLEEKYGKKEAAARIVATTDPENGALRTLAREEKYAAFDIPRDIGGRFSVLTPVGLFPVAFAGINITKLVRGASGAIPLCSKTSIDKNSAARYAVNRNILFRRGKTIEVLATFQPHLHFVGEWWKQLAGESEGKNHTGIFPSVLDYTTDLHSLGQWMQDGVRCVFETFVILQKTRETVTVPYFKNNSDGLNYLKRKPFESINENAYKGTLLAHSDGGVPVSTIALADRSEETLGQLFYFF
ncbi:MAG: glucose-6-phosphate isomerase, partial [Chitinivibrionales bacterium]|nr:glucose-6-phosphate isomerase [Chitinivibrionales bacterium]